MALLLSEEVVGRFDPTEAPASLTLPLPVLSAMQSNYAVKENNRPCTHLTAETDTQLTYTNTENLCLWVGWLFAVGQWYTGLSEARLRLIWSQ